MGQLALSLYLTIIPPFHLAAVKRCLKSYPRLTTRTVFIYYITIQCFSPIFFVVFNPYVSLHYYKKFIYTHEHTLSFIKLRARANQRTINCALQCIIASELLYI